MARRKKHSKRRHKKLPPRAANGRFRRRRSKRGR